MNGHVLVVLVGWSTTTTTTDVIESGRSVMYGRRGVDKSSPSIVSIREREIERERVNGGFQARRKKKGA